MASKRNTIIQELLRRLRKVSGVVTVLRNPSDPPDIGDYPAISLFSLPDRVTQFTMDDLRPTRQREWTIFIVIYAVGSDQMDDELAEIEVNELLQLMFVELYADGINLGGAAGENGMFVEDTIYEPVKPFKGKPGIGIPVSFHIHYDDEVTA
jgi:hypothetical protein